MPVVFSRLGLCLQFFLIHLEFKCILFLNNQHENLFLYNAMQHSQNNWRAQSNVSPFPKSCCVWMTSSNWLCWAATEPKSLQTCYRFFHFQASLNKNHKQVHTILTVVQQRQWAIWLPVFTHLELKLARMCLICSAASVIRDFTLPPRSLWWVACSLCDTLLAGLFCGAHFLQWLFMTIPTLWGLCFETRERSGAVWQSFRISRERKTSVFHWIFQKHL